MSFRISKVFRKVQMFGLGSIPACGRSRFSPAPLLEQEEPGVVDHEGGHPPLQKSAERSQLSPIKSANHRKKLPKTNPKRTEFCPDLALKTTESRFYGGFRPTKSLVLAFYSLDTGFRDGRLPTTNCRRSTSSVPVLSGFEGQQKMTTFRPEARSRSGRHFACSVKCLIVHGLSQREGNAQADERYGIWHAHTVASSRVLAAVGRLNPIVLFCRKTEETGCIFPGARHVSTRTRG